MRRFFSAPLLLCLLVTALITGIIGYLPLSPASATPPGWQLGRGLGNAEIWVGQQRRADGVIAYCAEHKLLTPGDHNGYTEAPEGSYRRIDGSDLSPQENSAVGYLMNRYAATDDHATAASVQLAIWSFTSADSAWGSPGMEALLKRAALPDHVVHRARRLSEEALKQSGPYHVELRLTEQGLDKVEASIRVLSAYGIPVPGIPLQLSSDGSLAHPPLSLVSDAEQITVPLRRESFGPGTVRVSASVPPAMFRWLEPKDRTRQQLLLIPGTTEKMVETSLARIPAATVTVTTRTSEPLLRSPGELRDRLRVEVQGQRKWPMAPGTGQPVQATLASSLWGPLATQPTPSAQIPAGIRLAGANQQIIDGPGDYLSDPVHITEPGYYVWTSTVEASKDQPKAAQEGLTSWSSTFGEPEETSILAWTPMIRTELSAREAALGESVRDLLHITNVPDELDAPVSLTMYGPLPERPIPSTRVPEGARVFSTVTGRLRDGEQIPFPAFEQPGCYTVVASVNATEQINEVRTEFGEPAETVCVTGSATQPPSTSAEVQAETEPEPLAETGATGDWLLASATALVTTGLLALAMSTLVPARSRTRRR